MTPEALLFDMDGLLLDTERQHLIAFQEIMDDLGIAKPDEDEAFFLTLVGCSMQTTRESLDAYVPAHVGAAGVLAAWDARADARARQDVPLRPFVREVLSALHAKGHRMAVVTSTQGQRARAKLEKTGLLPFFEVVRGGDEVSANKPDPAPYLETAAALGVRASASCAFEDSDRGIASAVAAGCLSTQIPDLRPQGLALPDLGQEVAADLKAAVVRLGLLP